MASAPSQAELIGGVEKREIRIVDHDPAWPQEFEAHRRVIAAALAAAALQIEHVGSTSVQGLAAKPIIDILLIVESSAEERAYLPQLEAVGYELRAREPDWHEHRMLRTPEKDLHLHVFSAGCAEIERMLAFRDRLRADAEDRRRYEALKRALAKADWPDMNSYAVAKAETIEAIIAAARAAGAPSSL